MTSGGVIIRLIDVALIILFGFVAITDIQSKSQIKLPGQTDASRSSQQSNIDYFIVKIDSVGYFRIEAQNETIANFAEIGALEKYLISQNRRSSQVARTTVVVIDPDETSVVQRTVDVFDLCERNGIAKAIHFKDGNL